MKTNTVELFWTLAPIVAAWVVIALIVMAAPSIEEVMGW